MSRHDLLNIHPAKASWQGTTACALDETDATGPNQNGGSTHRLCCVLRTGCRPLGRYASHPTDDRGSPRNDTNPKSP